ncbi:hypothetical protein ACA910_009553 [Epithemia clementina (nom. ined.)]
MARKQHSISQKLAMVRTLDQRTRNNRDALRLVARDLGVDPSQLRRWKAQSTRFEEMLSNRKGARVNAAAASVHTGRKSCLHGIEEDLLSFIMESRDQGLAVSIRMVMTKASQLDGQFRETWMVERSNEGAQRFTPPSRETVATWVVEALQNLPTGMIKRSWRHQPYSYYENEEAINNDDNHDNYEEQNNNNEQPAVEQI